MKTILFGSIAFAIWCSASTYYYVCEVKDLCPDKQILASDAIPFEKTATMDLKADSEPMPEPAPEIAAPGSFTIYYQFNHEDFIMSDKLNDYLEDLRPYIDQNPTAKISIVGFSDNIGSEEFNRSLGLSRANYMKNYFITSGIAENAIVVSSKGETNPVASNTSEPGRAKNRRSEISIN